MLEEKYTLNDNTTLPAVGFGTYKLKGRSGADAIKSALSIGYRLIDTAYNYENEGTVGKAIKESGLPRSAIHITSKLPGRYQQYNLALSAIEESMYRLGVDYIDSYLIHWPNPSKGLYVEAWKALIEAKKRGYVKTIGVSNFLPEHIEKLEKETGVLPAINQIEIYPYFNNLDTIKYCQKRGIVVEAWSPLGRDKKDELFKEPILITLSQKYNKSIAQIILRWHSQLGVIAIPKSSTSDRQKENFEIFDFELTEKEMESINSLSKKDGRTNNQDPRTYEEF